ncbi:MAG: xylulokinase, partial [Candidatus Hinthialibacter sp.]
IRSDQGPAFGAAIMAGVGSGVYASIPKACDAIIEVVQRTEPDEARMKEYDEYYAVYHSLYPGIREACHTLSKKLTS